ncbi:MAG: T9SS type A sorting domain-containing protein, partial [Candidatus Eisenbacteria bacterium]|nr:T9SS type A sorting domain-containing protein [Candidatus Eisenbacteria bacterium]
TNPGGSWVTITYDDFESGFGSYTDGGNDCARYRRANYSYQGRSSIRIRDNSGVSSSFYHTNGYNVTGYTDLEVDFYFYSRSMENGEDFFVEYYDGSSWQTVAQYVAGTHFNNNSFWHATVSIPSSSFNYATDAKIRFRNDASNNNDQIYVDQVTFRGMSGARQGRTAYLVEEVGVTPMQFRLAQNNPNPFRAGTNINFTLGSDSEVTIQVFDTNGRLVDTIADGFFGAGTNTVQWDGQGNSAGIYFYRIVAGEFTETKRMILIK